MSTARQNHIWARKWFIRVAVAYVAAVLNVVSAWGHPSPGKIALLIVASALLIGFACYGFFAGCAVTEEETTAQAHTRAQLQWHGTGS
jgi:hypothetical protein